MNILYVGCKEGRERERIAGYSIMAHPIATVALYERKYPVYLHAIGISKNFDLSMDVYDTSKRGTVDLALHERTTNAIDTSPLPLLSFSTFCPGSR